MKTVCLHGAESTGKTVLAGKLGYPWVPEYGRAYCEARGTDLVMADLLTIAAGQAAANRRAMGQEAPLLVLDTEQLMTAARAPMQFCEVPDALVPYPQVDLYLLFEHDMTWFHDVSRCLCGN